jgi:peptidoglycan/LPS O-acetylase OafA/YrhL
MYTLGIVLIILPYFFGYSNPIRTFLENEAFQFVSKISFSGYMIHFIIILRRASQIDTTQYLEPWLIFNYSCQDTIMILVAAFIMCLVV